MNTRQLLKIGGTVLALALCGGAMAQESRVPFVRIVELKIDPAQMVGYREAVKEAVATSVRVEQGVLAIYAVTEMDSPSKYWFFEMYADEASYNAHLESAHFKKYVAATKDMIMSRTVIDSVPIQLSAKNK